jgi:hypothetical protein
MQEFTFSYTRADTDYCYLNMFIKNNHSVYKICMFQSHKAVNNQYSNESCIMYLPDSGMTNCILDLLKSKEYAFFDGSKLVYGFDPFSDTFALQLYTSKNHYIQFDVDMRNEFVKKLKSLLDKPQITR